MPAFDSFKRAVGLKPTLRRRGSPWFNLMVGAVLGVVSGNYIFREPLELYWEEQRQLKASSSSSSSSPRS
eukprot:CAMPEP_0172485404 /NCGR_PEP_ID=MMETSP1066-20121228/13471_1 /TAXON_ID=671091 /ORGANISM="Coscinodiscus wailesii, Strain CCMP2513" /LENGTH=69 /DNA_ID=CAMNT_0013250679 /DNA_START=57 /DNA_END=266 /DNA_ORIENTATION=-